MATTTNAWTINAAGQVLSNDEVREDRRRKGFCDTCGIEPNQCFRIKKRMGGFYHDRIPLTIPGKVLNGVCLDCNPERDPLGAGNRRVAGERGHRRRRNATTEEPPTQTVVPRHPHLHAPPRRDRRLVEANVQRRSNSVPMVDLRPFRQTGTRNLYDEEEHSRYAQSFPLARVERADSGQLEHLEREYGNDAVEQEQAPREEEYVQEIEYNIFNEPVLVRKKRSRSKRNLNAGFSPTRNGGGNGNGYGREPPRGHSPHEMHELDFYSIDNDDAPPPSPPRNRVPYQQDSGRHISPRNDRARPHSPNEDHDHRHCSPQEDRSHPDDEQKDGSLPSLLKGKSNLPCPQAGDGEELDALAALCAAYVDEHPEEAVRFVPGEEVLGNAEIQLPEMVDDLSVMTPDTFFTGRGTLMSRQAPRPAGLAAIGEGNEERSSGGNTGAGSESSGGGRRSLVSHRIREPAVPAQAARQAGIPIGEVEGGDDDRRHVPTRDDGARNNMETYLESFTPELATLREIVGQCTLIGADDSAIETITGALIHDNATSMSMDLALFCLTTLWVLARKSDENKHKIIFEDATFDAIIEAMQIYRDASAEIQNRACGVLWSLSMDPDDRKHVAQGGGCDAILNAMTTHPGNDEVQVMGLGALKVLSFDTVGQSTLRSRGAMATVADVMRRYADNPAVQSEGCVILGNLAAPATSAGFAAPVGEREVDAVVRGILNHPDSLEVHEAACFTLMRLASLASNVELIRKDGNARVALELAFREHREDVGNSIFMLLRRLGFEMPTASPG